MAPAVHCELKMRSCRHLSGDVQQSLGSGSSLRSSRVAVRWGLLNGQPG